jgi:hypothetical protein
MLALFIVSALVTGAIGGAIRQNQGSDFWGGFAWGALLGVIGIVIVLATKPKVAVPTGYTAVSDQTLTPEFQSPSSATGFPPHAQSATKACPDCAEPVLLAARKCRHCGWQFEEQRLSA